MADNGTKEHGNGNEGPRKVIFRHATSDQPGQLSALQREQLDAIMGDKDVRLAAMAHLLGAGNDPEMASKLTSALDMSMVQPLLEWGIRIAQALDNAQTDPEGALDTLLATYGMVMKMLQPIQATQAALKEAINGVALPLQRNVRAHGYEAMYSAAYMSTSYPKAQLEGLAAASPALEEALGRIAVTKEQPAKVIVRKV